VLPVDVRQTRAALSSAAQRFAGLVADGVDMARPVPGLEWTAGETIAHVVTVARGYAQFARGEANAADILDPALLPGRPHNQRIAALNAAQIAAFDRADLPRSGELVRAAVADFLSATDGRDSDAPFPSVAAVSGIFDVGETISEFLGELLIHGLDVARALGRPWVISSDEARLVLTGVVSVLPDSLDRAAAGDIRATYDIRVRGGPRFAVRVHDGRLEVTTSPTERVDCHISADPVTFLLVGYGRESQWPAALRGKLLAWGRRPWLGLRFGRLLLSP